jgi:hypothetical protein
MKKAKYTEPCTHCGYYCRSSLCPAGEEAFPGEEAPCPGIFIKDGLTFCGLVLIETIAVEAGAIKPVVAKLLGVGCGCSCPDYDTTAWEVKRFDELARAQITGG